MILLFQQASLLALGTVFPGAISLVAALLAHSPISSKARPSSSSSASLSSASSLLGRSASSRPETRHITHRGGRAARELGVGAARIAPRRTRVGACDGVIVCSCPDRPARHRLTPSP